MTPALIKCLIDFFNFLFSCSSPTSSSRVILEEFIEKTRIFSWSAKVSCLIAQAAQVKHRQALRPIVQVLQLWCGLVHLQGWQPHFCNQNWHSSLPLCHPTSVSRCWGAHRGWTHCATALSCTPAARGIHSLRRRTSLPSSFSYKKKYIHPIQILIFPTQVGRTASWSFQRPLLCFKILSSPSPGWSDSIQKTWHRQKTAAPSCSCLSAWFLPTLWVFLALKVSGKRRRWNKQTFEITGAPGTGCLPLCLPGLLLFSPLAFRRQVPFSPVPWCFFGCPGPPAALLHVTIWFCCQRVKQLNII